LYEYVSIHTAALVGIYNVQQFPLVVSCSFLLVLLCSEQIQF